MEDFISNLIVAAFSTALLMAGGFCSPSLIRYLEKRASRKLQMAIRVSFALTFAAPFVYVGIYGPNNMIYTLPWFFLVTLLFGPFMVLGLSEDSAALLEPSKRPSAEELAWRKSYNRIP